jgi:hypothetical protein
MFSHHWSKVLTLAASIYPVRVSKKTRLGWYFSRFLAFISFNTTFPFRCRSVEEATINLLGRWVPETEGFEILGGRWEPKKPLIDQRWGGALQGGRPL